jgi:hypothetical protein
LSHLFALSFPFLSTFSFHFLSLFQFPVSVDGGVETRVEVGIGVVMSQGRVGLTSDESDQQRH